VWDRLRLYWEGFREIELPLPSFGEQSEIVTHVRSETSRLDALRGTTQRTIVLIRERRAALIAAAVTGQIEIAAATALVLPPLADHSL
jgi:type I restriction enzyme S subunit